MLALPRILPGVFWVMVGLGTYWLISIGRFKAWSALAGIALGAALFAYGAWLVWTWPRQREKTREAPLARGEEVGRPWLLSRPWRRRRIVHGTPLSTGIMVLAWIFFGLPAALFLGAGIFGGVSAEMRVQGLAMGGVLAFVLAGISYWRFRHWRFGDSVCRLITLPGAVGGWLKVDVECGLPGGGAAVVRLRNMIPGRHSIEVWRMEKTVEVSQPHGGRVLVPVRLQVSRSPEQQLAPLQPGNKEWLLGAPYWLLEVEQKLPGIDYFARFVVPIYDVPPSLVDEGPPPPELPLPPDRVRPVVAATFLVLGLAAAVFLTHRANWLQGGFFAPGSDWLSRAGFARQMDVWPDFGYYPVTIEGRCAGDGVQYRGDWKPIPAGTRFMARYDMDERHYELRNREYAASGYAGSSVTRYNDCGGSTKVHAVWLKRT